MMVSRSFRSFSCLTGDVLLEQLISVNPKFYGHHVMSSQKFRKNRNTIGKPLTHVEHAHTRNVPRQVAQAVVLMPQACLGHAVFGLSSLVAAESGWHL